MDDGKQDATTGGKRKQTGCMGWGWPFTIVVVVFGAIVLYIFLWISTANVFRVNDKPKEAEVKSNLHNIQLAIERYATDHGGQYPPYLIGGQGKYSEYVEDSANAFINIKDCSNRSILSDPLLREGYIEAYPKNPFATNGPAIHHFQGDLNDPLRNGMNEAKIHGTRFGPYCTLMGNVMADNRYTEFTVRDDKGVEHTYPTFASVNYPFHDLWETNKPKPFLPGEFFYRSYSLPVNENGVEREDIETYMLGAYGAIRTKGKDVIGPDPTGVNDVTPFGAEPNMYGNPNGIRDSIILVLVPAEDVPPKRKAE
jgi:hypothetical protein